MVCIYGSVEGLSVISVMVDNASLQSVSTVCKRTSASARSASALMQR